MDRIGSRFTRYEPRQHAAALILGLMSGLDRKNCWTIAEQRGHGTPDGLQHLLGRAKWTPRPSAMICVATSPITSATRARCWWSMRPGI